MFVANERCLKKNSQLEGITVNGNTGIILEEDLAYRKQLEDMILNIQPVSNEEQCELVERYRDLDYASMSRIYVSYPKRYRTILSIRLNIYKDVIYIQNGYGYKDRTYCNDNRIRSILVLLKV